MSRSLAALFLLLAVSLFANCRRQSDSFVVALETRPETLDAMRGTDASSERLRQLMFNTLVKKDEKFEYVGDLATTINASPDGLTFAFTLPEGVTFHDGRALTSADAKYTLDTLLASDSRKAASFYEGSGANRQSYIDSIAAPDAKTLVITLKKPWNQLLNNLVAIPVIPQGSAETQKDRPVGSGPFRFVRYDEPQQYVDLEAFDKYWQGAPPIKKLRVRVILDPNTLQAELKSGRIDLVPPFATLSPDAYQSFQNDPNFKVEKFPGANIVYLQFNVEGAPLTDARVRQAIAYGINRESLVRDLLLNQAEVAHSILPRESWAYAAGQQYAYDQERAKKILDEANFKPGANGMRFSQPIVFKISSGNVATRQFSTVMQNSLKEIGIPVEIESLELNSLLDQLRNGQYQMTTSRWIGGNQDPIFLRDLFSSTQIPTQADRSGRNRSRYHNDEADGLLAEAISSLDRDRQRALYVRVQEIVSRDLPMLPLWYPSQMIIARRGVGNIKIDGSGDWSFLRSVTSDK
ncbi:MAG TPA: ABC transporter substrate-binding protein [Pyrinomonadaceae bacterium]|nr:ABC transporter substrate-binding protein [Pyrinomonadaceae bacterium]